MNNDKLRPLTKKLVTSHLNLKKSTNKHRSVENFDLKHLNNQPSKFPIIISHSIDKSFKKKYFNPELTGLKNKSIKLIKLDKHNIADTNRENLIVHNHQLNKSNSIKLITKNTLDLKNPNHNDLLNNQKQTFTYLANMLKDNKSNINDNNDDTTTNLSKSRSTLAVKSANHTQSNYNITKSIQSIKSPEELHFFNINLIKENRKMALIFENDNTELNPEDFFT